MCVQRRHRCKISPLVIRDKLNFQYVWIFSFEDMEFPVQSEISRAKDNTQKLFGNEIHAQYHDCGTSRDNKHADSMFYCHNLECCRKCSCSLCQNNQKKTSRIRIITQIKVLNAYDGKILSAKENLHIRSITAMTLFLPMKYLITASKEGSSKFIMSSNGSMN